MILSINSLSDQSTSDLYWKAAISVLAVKIFWKRKLQVFDSKLKSSGESYTHSKMKTME
jgi:hypothetical protein